MGPLSIIGLLLQRRGASQPPQSHLSQGHQQATAPPHRQHLPEVRGQFLAVAHRGIQANAPGHEALEARVSGFRPILSNYQRHLLWDIEAIFHAAKHLFATRPIFHKLDETIRGRVFCSFLALVLKTELESRIQALGREGSWTEILADLNSLTETEMDQDGKRFLLRSAPKPFASLALKAAGIVLPPTILAAEAS
jgi:hypothetical protein